MALMALGDQLAVAEAPFEGMQQCSFQTTSYNKAKEDSESNILARTARIEEAAELATSILDSMNKCRKLIDLQGVRCRAACLRTLFSAPVNRGDSILAWLTSFQNGTAPVAHYRLIPIVDHLTAIEGHWSLAIHELGPYSLRKGDKGEAISRIVGTSIEVTMQLPRIASPDSFSNVLNDLSTYVSPYEGLNSDRWRNTPVRYLNGQPSFLPASEGPKFSPLELAIMESEHRVKQTRTLANFVLWAREEKSNSAFIQEIGVVRSIHLYRERNTALHHEFAIISFGRNELPTSWLRVERAARLKDNWLKIQADSIGPLWGGVALRESVSFNSSLDTLAGKEVDEVARIIVQPTDSPTVLNELATRLDVISKSRGRYELFTANCRWFSRQVVLSFAQRTPNVERQGIFLWKGQSVSYSELHDRIQKEPFGGPQLVDATGVLVQVEGHIELARAALSDDKGARSSEALALCDIALGVLSANNQASFQQQRLAALAHNARSLALHELHRDDEAIVASQVACSLARSISLPDSSPASFAILINNHALRLSDAGRSREAVEAAQEAVAIWRRLCVGDTWYYPQNLASNLSTLSKLLSDIDRHDEAIEAGNGAKTLQLSLMTRRPDLHRLGLAYMAFQHYLVRSKAGHHPRALREIRHCIILLKGVVKLRPEDNRLLDQLASAHFRHAGCAAQLELWDEAWYASEEALNSRRLLFSRDPNTWRAVLARDLVVWSGHLRHAGMSDVAIDALSGAVSLFRTLVMLDHSYSQELQECLSSLSTLRDLVTGLGRGACIL